MKNFDFTLILWGGAFQRSNSSSHTHITHPQVFGSQTSFQNELFTLERSSYKHCGLYGTHACCVQTITMDAHTSGTYISKCVFNMMRLDSLQEMWTQCFNTCGHIWDTSHCITRAWDSRSSYMRVNTHAQQKQEQHRLKAKITGKTPLEYQTQVGCDFFLLHFQNARTKSLLVKGWQHKLKVKYLFTKLNSY